MGSSQVGAARYVVVAVAQAAERAAAWLVAHAAAGLAAVVARQSVALKVHVELESGYSVVAAEVKAHSQIGRAHV